MKYFLYIVALLFLAAITAVVIISYMNRGVGQSLVDSSVKPTTTPSTAATPIPTPTPLPIGPNTKLEETLNNLSLPDLKTDIDTLRQEVNNLNN